MPLYEYQCQACKERMEILQRVSDPPYTHCPKCGGEMKKLISSPAIQFKGSGFYKTDYASTSTAKSSESSESKSETKSDAKTTEKKSSD
jgi:putative FmdB family regulatory protein